MSFFSSFFEASKSCVNAIQSGDLTKVKQHFGTGLVSTLKALRNVLDHESPRIETAFIKPEARENESMEAVLNQDDDSKLDLIKSEPSSLNSSPKSNGFKKSESSEDFFDASSESVIFEGQEPRPVIIDRAATAGNFPALIKSEEQAAVETCIATANTVTTSFSIFQDVTGKELDKTLPPKQTDLIDLEAEVLKETEEREQFQESDETNLSTRDVRLDGFLPKSTSTPKTKRLTKRKPRFTELQAKMRENMKVLLSQKQKASSVENGSETSRTAKRMLQTNQSGPLTTKLQNSFTESRKRKVDVDDEIETPKSKRNLQKNSNQSWILQEKSTTKEPTIQNGTKIDSCESSNSLIKKSISQTVSKDLETSRMTPSSPSSRDDTASTFTCKDCLETIRVYQPLNLFNHILGHVPKDLYLFECEECEERFATRRDQKTHMAFKHASSEKTITKDADRILEEFFQFGQKICPGCSPLLEVACNQMRIKIGLPSL